MQATPNKLLVVGFALGFLVLGGAAESARGKVTSEQVRSAIQKGVGYLRKTQGLGGDWPRVGVEGGSTGLNLLAMLNAGVPSDDPQVAAGLRALRRIPNERTYVVSLKAQVYAAVLQSGRGEQPAGTAARLREAARFLISGQRDNGMWSYGGARRGGGDNSNTQFALLGLHEAAKAGVPVPRKVWDRARVHFRKNQCKDGGWAYRGPTKSYGSMTAAGLANLYITGQELHVGGRKVFRAGAYPDCGKYRQNIAVAAGLNWINRNFSVTENPGKGRQWLYYYLYALERVGMISGLRNFGEHDWYRRGAEFLVADQRPDGSWGRAGCDTAFALLFLAKGNRPVLIQKLRWNGHWNRNLHDLENLTVFIDDKLGKKVTWQTTGLDLPLAELRQGPILYIAGHEYPKFTEAEKRQLRRFVDAGGTLLAEACCGKKPFARGFRIMVNELFPEHRLRPLKASHPVFRSHYKITDTYGLEGIDAGCRTSVFFSPRALSSLWELKTIPNWSDKAFKLGTNIAAYATGRQLLGDKLDKVELPTADPDRPPVEVPRGAVRIARLIHEGDYNADPRAMLALAAILRDNAGVDVVARTRHLRSTDESVFEYPVLFMTGHFSFELPEAEIEALRIYLQRGGFLFADACCGRKAFDQSFRQMVRRLFPEAALEPAKPDHPIYTGEIGVPLGELRYRKILADELKSRGTIRPPLEVVLLEGRTAILYSKYDFSCALEGDNPYSSRGYVEDDGRKLGMNVVLYAIGY